MKHVIGLILLLGCATPTEIQYEAAYRGIVPKMVVSLALEATVSRGYRVVARDQKLHHYSFITEPIRVDGSTADLAFLVQLIYRVETRNKMRFEVFIFPKAFESGREVGDERLPARARSLASDLANAIRAHSRRYEVPI